MLTTQQLKEQLPIDATQIGSGTDPVSDESIEDWQAEARSELRGALSEAGLSLSNIESDEEGAIHSAVRSYVTFKVMHTLGGYTEAADTHQEEWEQALEDYRNRPGAKVDAGSSVKSNVDTSRSEHSFHFVGDTDRW